MPKPGRPPESELRYTIDLDDVLVLNMTLGSVGTLQRLVEAVSKKPISRTVVENYVNQKNVTMESSLQIEAALSVLRDINDFQKRFKENPDQSVQVDPGTLWSLNEILNFYFRPIA